MHEAEYKTCGTAERFLDGSARLSRSWHSFCPFSALVFSLTFDTAAWQVCSGLHRLMLAGGRKGGGWGVGGCGALALPQVARGFYLHGPHWKTGPQPWHNSPQVFDSTKLLKLLPSQLLLNPCGCLGVPLVLLCLTCFVLCSVKILIIWEGDWRKNIVFALNNTSL